MADTLQTIKCPACGREMEKVFIPTEGINLDICTQGCGGIFFDNRELEKFDEKNEDISKILEKLEGKNFITVSEDAVRICPSCGQKMVKNHSSIHNTIEIDECYACGGKFLDRDELIKIRAEYDTEEDRSEDVLKEMYRTVGCELAEQDRRYAAIKPDRSLLRSIVSKIIEG